MKKSLIALAVAGAFAAPAFAATSNVDVYGVLNIAIQDTDVAGSDMTILDNTSRIGFKGTEDLGGGLKAVWQIESALGGNGTTAIGSTNACAPGAGVDGVFGTKDDTVTCATRGLGSRNTFVGLAGGFGTVLMGRHDTPYKLGTVSLDIFGDTIGDYNLGRLDGVQLISDTHDHRNGQALAYVSPTWSGFHFAAAVVMSNGESGSALNTADTIDAMSFTGVYANGPLFLSLSFQDADAAAPASDTAWKLGAGYTFGDTKVGFVYEDIEDARDSWLLNVAHTMGPIVLKAQYGQADVAAADQSAWMLGVDYNMSKRTAVYFVYGSGDNDAAGDQSGWNLGVKHSF